MIGDAVRSSSEWKEILCEPSGVGGKSSWDKDLERCLAFLGLARDRSSRLCFGRASPASAPSSWARGTSGSPQAHPDGLARPPWRCREQGPRVRAPSASPRGRRGAERRAPPQGRTRTGVSLGRISKSSSTSRLRRRTQPSLAALPRVSGSQVPWKPSPLLPSQAIQRVPRGFAGSQ
jgi:hypothetical protein